VALFAFASAKGAPGVTTTVLALAFAWPRPALVVEADMSGSSSILSGYLAGQVDHSHGLVNLSVSAREHGVTRDRVWEQCLQIGTERYVLPGIADPAQAAGLTTTWGPLAETLRSLEDAAVDVLVDCGRVGTAYSPLAMIRSADAVTLVTGSRLPDVYAVSRRAPSVAADLTVTNDVEGLFLLVVGEGRPYSAREIQTSVGVRTLPSIAWDPAAAAVFSVGASRPRRFESGPLMTSTAATAATLQSWVTHRRAQLTASPDSADRALRPTQSTRSDHA
jgi:hypothetical protein